MRLHSDRCAGCGAALEGGRDRCNELFQQVLARDFSDARFFAVHRMTVDTYCLQHPDDFCRSARSLAAHLMGLCLVLERGASSAMGPARLHRWLNGDRKLLKPDLPTTRGAIVLPDLPLASAPTAWHEAVRMWAVSTWDAYASLHALARDWVRQADEYAS